MISLKVVSNSTPLIALSRIGKLELLKQYFFEIIIPEAVYQEVVVSGGDLYGAKEVKGLDWYGRRYFNGCKRREIGYERYS
jgi:predicted nucleic acid-binding protein